MNTPTFCLGLVAVGSVLVGCNDRYEEGYAAGYAAGAAVSRRETAMDRGEQIETAPVVKPYVVTEVCGGGSVSLNGKQVRTGTKGCVRMFSDGTTQRY